jgi:hypothetical protein
MMRKLPQRGRQNHEHPEGLEGFTPSSLQGEVGMEVKISNVSLLQCVIK